MRYFTKTLFITGFIASVAFGQSKIQKQNISSKKREEIQLAINKLRSFNRMRETLAATIESSKPITFETFQSTCMPVGKALKNWAKTQGYQVRQISEKYRNPNHKPTKNEIEILNQFAKSNEKNDYIEKKSIQNGKEGIHLYMRIPVVKACLHCHGTKESRPSFIKDKYPNDLAFGFNSGDLRGAYSVFIPN